MTFNAYFENSFSNLYGVYTNGPIKPLLGMLRPNDSFFSTSAGANNLSALELNYRRIIDLDLLKKFTEIIGNYRDPTFNGLPIKKIDFDYVIDGQAMIIKNINNLDILLQQLISLVNILSGSPSQEDWNVQALFNEDLINTYASKGTVGEIMQKIAEQAQISLLGFKFYFDVRKNVLESMVAEALTSLADEVYEYTFDDLANFDYARYGEPINDFDPFSFYVQRVNEQESARQSINEMDLEARFGRGLADYAANQMFNVNLFKQGTNLRSSFFKFKKNFISLNKK